MPTVHLLSPWLNLPIAGRDKLASPDSARIPWNQPIHPVSRGNVLPIQGGEGRRRATPCSLLFFFLALAFSGGLQGVAMADLQFVLYGVLMPRGVIRG